MRTSTVDLRRYALMGIDADIQRTREHLEELEAQRAQLQRRDGQSAGVQRRTTAISETARRRRPKMTAEQRKAVSERMRKYWADRRKGKK